MGRYDKDIEENSYLNEHGKYVAQFARNHGISTHEAFENPTVKAHKEAIDHLRECRDFVNGKLRLSRH